jgi:hypothetical protein
MLNRSRPYPLQSNPPNEVASQNLDAAARSASKVKPSLCGGCKDRLEF